MTDIDKRWTEIQYSILCFGLYQTIKQYPVLIEYIQILADMSNVDRNKALKATQCIMQTHKVYPTQVEVANLAKKKKKKISDICRILRISKDKCLGMINSREEFKAIKVCNSDEDIEIMAALIKTYNKLRSIIL